MSHPIYDLLQAEPDPAVRRRIKAQAMAILDDMVGQSVDRGDFRITITALDFYPTYDALRIRVRVNRISNGNNVTPAGVNPIFVVNPPILVDDDAGDIVVTWQEQTGRNTHVERTRTLREDLRAALRVVVRDAVKGALT